MKNQQHGGEAVSEQERNVGGLGGTFLGEPRLHHHGFSGGRLKQDHVIKQRMLLVLRLTVLTKLDLRYQLLAFNVGKLVERLIYPRCRAVKQGIKPRWRIGSPHRSWAERNREGHYHQCASPPMTSHHRGTSEAR